MLSGRFRTLTMHLLTAIAALVVRGRMPCAAVAAIGGVVAQRSLRLQALMDLFAAGKLRTRKTFATRRAKRAGERAPVARAARPWPEHIAGWLHLVGLNHPSMDVRYRWNLGLSPNQRHLVEFVRGLRALVETDGEMHGMLGLSREGRRLSRWFLRTGDKQPLPAILREPARARPARPAGEPRPPRRRRDRWAPPKPAREPGPFETPPRDLTREERERRGMWVPPPRVDPVPGLPSVPMGPAHTIMG